MGVNPHPTTYKKYPFYTTTTLNHYEKDNLRVDKKTQQNVCILDLAYFGIIF